MHGRRSRRPGAGTGKRYVWASSERYHDGTMERMPAYHARTSAAWRSITSISTCPNGIAHGREPNALGAMYSRSLAQHYIDFDLPERDRPRQGA